MNLNQINKRLRKERDKQVVAEVAGRFERRATTAFAKGDMAAAAQLRETAETLRSVSTREATRFLGTVFNAMQEESSDG